MRIPESHARAIAAFGRRIAKAPTIDVIASDTFKMLRRLGADCPMRLVYSPSPAVWREWKEDSNGVANQIYGTYPKPRKRELTIFFDSNDGQSGFISIERKNAKADGLLEVLAQQVWSALLLQSALERFRSGVVSGTELVRERLRARDEERRHIARELHDDLGQLTASLKLRLRWAEDQVREESGLTHVARELSSVRNNIGALHIKLRSLSHTLYPGILDTLGLAAAVRELASQVARYSSIKVRCTTRGIEPPAEEAMGVAIYRCCQEAVSNAIRHAKASRLNIQLQFLESEVRLRVQDDGCGFNPRDFYDSNGRLRTSGFWSIRQRMTDLGGSFRVSTAKGKGTLVEISAPYPSQKPHAKTKDKAAHRG
jgi:signal transduction histidine kinase